MKSRNLFAAALIAAIAFTSCSDEDNVSTTNNLNIVRFESSVDGMPTTRNIINGDGSGQFTDGDIWGIYGKISDPDSWPLYNDLYTIGTTKLYWNDISQDKPVVFSAYYPAMVVSDPTAFEYDVVTAFFPDLLVATPVTVSKGQTVAFNFKHVMHKLSIDINVSNIPNADLSNYEFEILGMKSSVKINLLTGDVDYAGASGSNVYDKRNFFDLTWLLAPQDLVPGTPWIRVSGYGKTYTFKVPDDLGLGNTANPTRLESGARSLIYLTLYPSGSGRVSVATVSEIIGWGTWQIMPDTNLSED